MEGRGINYTWINLWVVQGSAVYARNGIQKVKNLRIDEDVGKYWEERFEGT